MWTVLSISALFFVFIVYWVVFFVLCYRFVVLDRDGFSRVRGSGLVKYFKSKEALDRFGVMVVFLKFLEIFYYILFLISMVLFVVSVIFVRDFI